VALPLDLVEEMTLVLPEERMLENLVITSFLLGFMEVVHV